MGEILFRSAEVSDLEEAHSVFMRSLNDGEAKHGLSPFVASFSMQRSLWNHLLETSANKFWIAETKKRIIGIACAVTRNYRWWLAELFVLPEYQSSSVGKELLNHVLVSGDEYEFATCSPSHSPAAVAIYIRSKLIHLTPVISLYGGVPSTTSLKTELQQEAIVSITHQLEHLDTLVWGGSRPEDLSFFMQDANLLGFMVYSGNMLVGYYFVSQFGGIGPVATINPKYMPAILDMCANRLKSIGFTDTISLWVPGQNTAGLNWLLQHGFRISSVSLLQSSSKKFGKMDNYITSGPDLF